MRRLLFLVPLISLIPMSVSAISVSCGGIPDASGCQQCFSFVLGSSNDASDTFVPRTGIPSGQQEYIDLTRSTVTASAYQGATVTPVGNITNSFVRVENGPNATAAWLWAKTTGKPIIRGNIPTTINYANPVYGVKFTTVSRLKNQSDLSIVTGTEVTHLECGFFYVSAPQIVCGNGAKEGTEQCDDGNTNNYDACSNSCRLPVCGNSIKEYTEQCDDGNQIDTDLCSNTCILPLCGDRKVSGNEQCDDGNTNNNDGCSNTCRLPFCGNGAKEGTEQCDDGNSNNSDACNNQCRIPGSPAFCGNGVPEGSEQCDDGNTNNNDGCSTSCLLPVCGNGTREGSEQCDDGNTNNTDSCTNQCRTPGSTSLCGNGIAEGSEQCDDGNASNTDSCSTTCRIIAVNPQCRVQAFDAYGSVPLTTTLSCSGEPRGRTVIVITRNNTMVDTSETMNEQFTFKQAGRYTVRCYPDAGANQNNTCSTIINVEGQCGNAIVEHGEMCDDGNTISGDLCDRSCRLTGSSCGNGILDRGEQCDDGNNSNNDTCTNICQREIESAGPLGMMSVLILTALLGAAGIVYYRSRRNS